MDIIRTAIIGLGGFAAAHHDTVLHLEKAGECKLICTCDPDPPSFRDRMQQLDFAGRGVRVFNDYREMLTECAPDLDAVMIPTPVPLHAEMHKACVERGLAVYLEKPPTLDYAELREMLHVEESARFLTNVGFNFIVEKPRQELKRRIVSGQFGRVRKVCYLGLWPRPASYYTRANWAGRLMKDGRLVLDFPIGNAVAHNVHNVLFWAREGELLAWAEPFEVRAELYRAHNIEGADTVLVNALTEGGVDIQIAVSHACEGGKPQREWVVCQEAVISYMNGEGYSIEWRDGRRETGEAPPVILTDNLLAYFDYLRGKTARPLTRLVDAGPFVRICDLTYIAARQITTIPARFLDKTQSRAAEGSDEFVSIRGIDKAFQTLFDRGRFPSEQEVPWGRGGSTARASDLGDLDDVVRAMVADRAAGH